MYVKSKRIAMGKQNVNIWLHYICHHLVLLSVFCSFTITRFVYSFMGQI